jgi:hypothetical protein
MKLTGMNKNILALMLPLFLALSVHAQEAAAKKFTIYVFLPWKVQTPDGKIDRSIKLTDYVVQFGLKPVKVIYEAAYLTNGKVDHEKIKAIAEATQAEPDSIVSFDTEFGKRFYPQTVIPEVLEILHSYRGEHPKAKVGVYATAPQNTYGWKSGIESYDGLNAKYKVVAEAVDFLSPVLYNYNRDDLDAWMKAATYNVNAAKKYGTDKPIIPYINPGYGTPTADGNGSNPVIQFSEKEMTIRLQKLYDLGASGCIVWGSSGDRDANGKQPVFDASTGWAKALVGFAQTHGQ